MKNSPIFYMGCKRRLIQKGLCDLFPSIQRAINDMKYYLLNLDSFDNEVNKKTSERIQEAFQILGIILPTLWW